MSWHHVFFLLIALVPSVMAEIPVQKKPMNFIVILLDDLGLHDTGFMGNDFIETPAIDQLARDGVVFTQAYANAPNCAPSRAAILSGQYAPRTGVYTMMTGDMGDTAQRKVQTPRNNIYLPEQVYTLAEMLRDHGYATASIGKWNLGHGPIRGPEGQGFDVNIGGHRGGVGTSYYAPYSRELPGLQDAPAGEYLTDRLNQEALQFIASNKQKPFFVYLSHYAPHFPIQAPEETEKKYQSKRKEFCEGKPQLRYCEMTYIYTEYAAMIEHVDRGIAQLRKKLEAEGLSGNTTIVLMSDNGGYAWAKDPQALRGMKSQLYEGGIRVPMVWLVPGNKSGSKVDAPVSGVDIYTTIASLANIPVASQVLDGADLSTVISATGKLQPRALYWYFPAYTLDTETDDADLSVDRRTAQAFFQVPAAAILCDGWKLIRYYDGSPAELYYLPDDPKESRNRFTTEKKRGRAMTSDLESWLEATGAAVSLPANPAYQADKKSGSIP